MKDWVACFHGSNSPSPWRVLSLKQFIGTLHSNGSYMLPPPPQIIACLHFATSMRTWTDVSPRYISRARVAEITCDFFESFFLFFRFSEVFLVLRKKSGVSFCFYRFVWVTWGFLKNSCNCSCFVYRWVQQNLCRWMTRFYIGYVLAGMLIAKDKVELEQLYVDIWSPTELWKKKQRWNSAAALLSMNFP